MSNITNAQFLAAFVLAAGSGTLVFFHAERNRIGHPSAWASGVFLAFAVVLPLYVLHVRRLKRQRGSPL